MANDLTAILSKQLMEVAQEAASSLADGSADKQKTKRPRSRVKSFVAGAGFALIAKKGVEVARSDAGAGLISSVSDKISATLAELQAVPGDEQVDATTTAGGDRARAAKKPQAARKPQAAKKPQGGTRATKTARSGSKTAAKSPANGRKPAAKSRAR